MASGTEVGRIYFTLDLDDAKYKAGMASSGSLASKFGSDLEKLGQTALNFAKRLTQVGIVAAGFAAFMGIKFNAQMETARQGFITLLGSAEEADKTIERIKKEAKRTPFEVQGLTQATQLLASVTKDGDKAVDAILAVGAALAATGKGQAELDRIILNLQQIGLTGQVTAMDIRQFGYAGVNILELLADHYNTTEAEAAEMIKNSKDGFGDLIAAFTEAASEGGRFEKAFTNQMGTFNQIMSNMKDTADQTFGFIFEPLFDSLKRAGTALLQFADTDAFDEIAQKARNSIGQLAGFLDQITKAMQTGGPQAALDLLKTKLAEIAGSIDFAALGNRIITGLIQAVESVPWPAMAERLTQGFLTMLVQINWSAIFAMIFKLVPQIVTKMIEGLIKAAIANPLDFVVFFLSLGFLPGRVISAAVAVLSKIPLLGPILGWIVQTLARVSSALVAPVKTFFTNLARNIINFLIAGLRAYAGLVRAYFDDFLGGIFRLISGWAGKFVDAGWALIRAFGSGIKNAFGEVVNVVKGGLQKVRDLLPFSDAKTGPLSDLTLSGQRFSQTFASGILRGANAIQDAATRALGVNMSGLAGSFMGSGGSGGETSNQYNQYAPIYVQTPDGGQSDFMQRWLRSDQLVAMGLGG